jgi:hypothetical protein
LIPMIGLRSSCMGANMFCSGSGMFTLLPLVGLSPTVLGFISDLRHSFGCAGTVPGRSTSGIGCRNVPKIHLDLSAGSAWAADHPAPSSLGKALRWASGTMRSSEVPGCGRAARVAGVARGPGG